MSTYVSRRVSVGLTDNSGYFEGDCSDWFSDGIELDGAMKMSGESAHEISYGRVFLPWHAVSSVQVIA